MSKLSIGRRIRRVAIFVLVCACSAGAAVAVASGQNGKTSNHRATKPYAFFKRTHTAHAALAGLGGQGAQSVTLASQPNEVISAVRQSDGNICLADRIPSLTAMACGHAEDIEELGAGLILPKEDSGGPGPRIIVLAPEGVTSVTYLTSNGESTTVPVANNVASFSSASLVSAHYAAPHGATNTINVSPPAPR
jgi:hypothetical protein